MHDPIQNAIEAVAAARLNLQEGEATRQLAENTVTRLRERIAERVAKQKAITARRLEGKETPEDAVEYAALEGDLNVLRGLQAEAEGVLKDCAARMDAKKIALARAESELAQAQSQAELDAIIARAREVEGAYVDCLRALWAAAKRNGHVRTFGEIFKIDCTLTNLCRLNSFQGLETQR